LKRTILFSILVAAISALVPLTATAQAAPASESASAERAEPSYKYQAYAGYGYTSINQVDQSRNGLQGVTLSLTREMAKYFSLTAQGGYYKYPYDTTNPGDPSVTMLLAGPEMHVPFFGKTSAFVHVLMGGQHTGGEGITPDINFAWGVGIGMDYKLNSRFSLRAQGDDINSFSAQDPDNLGTSSHRHANAHATIGVVYKF
jgi:opacity protein-like surface antigen